MAVKIFCNSCQKYIRDAKPDEISMLRGTEICTKCESSYSSTLVQVEKMAKRGIVRIERARDDAKASIEEAMRNVTEGENGKDE